MIPFERLRALVRHGDPDRGLLLELADALVELAADPGALVVGCRQLVHHHPNWGALWWLCSRALVGGEPGAADAARELNADSTADRLAAGLPFPPDTAIPWLGAVTLFEEVQDARPDLELVKGDAPRDATHAIVEPDAAIGDRVILPEGTNAALESLAATTRVWLVVPVGTVVPAAVLDRIASAADVEQSGLAPFDRVCGPAGLGPPSALARRDAGPLAPELLAGR